MGSTLQVVIRCCNDDLEIDEDDNEKSRPIIQQQPTLTKTKDKSIEVINDEDSFTTTIPCFQSVK